MWWRRRHHVASSNVVAEIHMCTKAQIFASCSLFSFLWSLSPFPILFLLYGVSLSMYVQYGETALMKASENGHTATVQVLLEAGADKDVKNDVRESEIKWEGRT